MLAVADGVREVRVFRREYFDGRTSRLRQFGVYCARTRSERGGRDSRATRKISGTRQNDVAAIDSKTKCRMSILRIVIRHCSRCAAKTELCVTVVFFEALVSFDSKVFTAYPGSDQLIHSTDLAVDLFNRSSNPETRRR